MDIKELNNKEKAIIEIVRAFNFLDMLDYHVKELIMGGRENPSIVYHNRMANRLIRIIGNECFMWSIIVQRTKIVSFKKESFVFDISDYYSSFNCAMIKGRNYTLKTQAEFIQQYLMPVIKGEIWIDELIKQKKE